MKPCIICGSTKFSLFHAGVRDNSNINVLRCDQCGMFQLSTFEHSQVENYASGEMRNCNFHILKKTKTKIDWESWIEITREDDDRRAQSLKELCRGKRVCEFGCGNGGFLRRINNCAEKIVGVEVDKECLQRLDDEGITVVESLENLEEKFDVVVMFHVIEHLSEPQFYLNQIYKVLTWGGVFVCETCNAQDALISLYKCDKFKDFTYWSEHVYLYDSYTLEKLINGSGFKTLKNDQIQRYKLSNHLYWLATGQPGGHRIWTEFNNEELNDTYEAILKKLGKCDTIVSYFEKGN